MLLCLWDTSGWVMRDEALNWLTAKTVANGINGVANGIRVLTWIRIRCHTFQLTLHQFIIAEQGTSIASYAQRRTYGEGDWNAIAVEISHFRSP